MDLLTLSIIAYLLFALLTMAAFGRQGAGDCDLILFRLMVVCLGLLWPASWAVLLGLTFKRMKAKKENTKDE